MPPFPRGGGREPSPFRGAAIGTSLVAISTVARLALVPLVGSQAPYVLHMVAIALATWFGGVGSGVLAAFVAAVAVDYFFIPPGFGLLPASVHDALSVAVFVGVALVLVWQVGRWRRAERGLREAVSEARRQEEAARHSEGRLTALMNAATESIYLIARDGTILAANRTAAERLRRPINEVVGRRWEELVPGEVVAERQRRLDAVCATAQPVQFEDLRDGIRFDHSFFPILDAAGVTTAVAVFSRDVTDQRLAEQALRDSEARYRELYRGAEQANRMKEQFLTTLSHELRTPLNAIVGWAHMLTAGALSETARQQAVAVIHRNALAQTRLVDDVLDMSRIVSGKFRLHVRPIDIRGFVDRALESLQPAAAARKLTVQVSIDAPVIVVGDGDRLQQVMWNLLSNAVKFTPEGGCITVTATRAASHVEIRVTDTGIGISKEFLPFVFDRFTQADGSTTRPYGGLGLGLAIVRHIVELHGGTVRADSEGDGRGSSFTVSLPVSEDGAARTSQLPSDREIAHDDFEPT